MFICYLIIICFEYGDDSTNLDEKSLNLPYVYTIETEVGMDMMKSKSSLNRLYNTVFPNGKFNINEIYLTW